MMKKIVFFALMAVVAAPLLFIQTAYAAIVINEIVVGGAQRMPDEDGDNQDWVELYNTRNAVNLSGMYLTDDENNFYKWALPNITLGEGQFLIVFCSGKDRNDSSGNLHTNFGLGSGEPVMLFDEDDGKLDEVTYEQTLTIPEDNALGRLPDGASDFIALPIASPGLPNIDPDDSLPGIVINEIMASNKNTLEFPSESGEYPDWIELYNPDSFAVNIKGYRIYSDDKAWKFTESQIIPSGGYLIVYANKADVQSPPQTDFKISSSGDTIRLEDQLGNTLDTVVCPALSSDTSYGRIPDGGASLAVMTDATPAAVNQSIVVGSEETELNNNAQYIVINEVVTSNKGCATDEDNESGDWIELYNISSTVAVNMEGLFIGDSGSQWEFPAITIQPQSYLLVWADKKDRTASELHTNFSISADGETITLYNTDGTTVEDEVSVPVIETDHSYGRIANGTGSFKELETATPSAANEDNVVITLNEDAQYITINEVVTSNSDGIVDEDNESGDWIELYNTSSTVAVNMEGLFIGDSGSQWTFPAVTMQPNTYLLVWADKKDKTGSELHTNFSISADGETITLYNTDATTVVNQVDVPAIESDHSYGRIPNGTGSFKELETTTPLAANVNNSDAAIEFITINEVSSDWEDATTFHDEENTAQDWIEFYNTSSSESVNLQGCKISDNQNTWVFPNVTIAPHQYLILFASGKDGVNVKTGEMHTNFRLESDGETLKFLNVNDTLIQQVEVTTMLSNQSYGHYPNGTGDYQILSSPTPGAANDGQDVTPPVTVLDYYDEGWHNSDVIVTLAATDNESDVTETYYIINNGAIESVGEAGQPVITTEGANNTLEYWSVDTVGNEELPHNILTDIKLDKTPPVVNIISPAESELFDSGLITVSGTVTDDISGVASLRINIDNYIYNATVDADDTFTVNNVEIIDGFNSITAVGTDLADNSSQDTAEAFLGWLMHLDVPYLEIENYYSGAACAAMILNYIRDGVDSVLTQQEVYDYGHPFNYEVNASLSEMDPRAIDYVLGHFDPYDTSDPYGQGNAYTAYNFVVKSFEETDFIPYLRDIIHWMAYPVKIDSWWLDGPLTAQPNVPPTAPIYGTYNHWVIINGAATNQNPAPEPTTNPSYTPDFTVYGLWLTDPASDGIGQDLYVTAQDVQTYFLPVVSEDVYNGKLVHVAEPPEALSDAEVEIAQPEVNEETAKTLEIVEALAQIDTSDLSESEAIIENAKKHYYDAALVVDLENDGKLSEDKIESKAEEDLLTLVFSGVSEPLVELDWKDIVDSSLLSDEEFREAFDGSQIREFIKVRRLDDSDLDYYLIPFDKYVKGQFLTYAAIIIDASDGSFRQASWVEEPTRFVQIKKDKALKLLFEKYSYLESIALDNAELVWEPDGVSDSPFYPYWKISFVDNEVYYINQGGEILSNV